MKDTLYDPFGKELYTRSWNLGTLAAGDQITLTYSISFDVYTTKPGTYRNEAHITGQRNNTTIKEDVERIPAKEAVGNVIFAMGQVLGAQSIGGGACSPLAGFLQMGSSNSAEVTKLQQFLNMEVGANLPVSGVYGPMTAAAVSRFQLKYAGEILTPAGLTAGTGSVYTSTLRKINSLCGSPTQAASAAAAVSANQIAPTPAATKPAAAKPAAKPAAAKPAASGGGNAVVNALGGWFNQFKPTSAPTIP